MNGYRSRKVSYDSRSLHFTSLHFILHSSLFLFNGVSHLIPFRRQITFIVFIPDNFN